MADQALLDYIKQTRASGFSDAEIKSALKTAGWTDREIAEGFGGDKRFDSPRDSLAMAQEPQPSWETNPGDQTPALDHSASKTGFLKSHGRLLLILLIILVALPALGFAGFLGYQKWLAKNDPEEIVKETPIDQNVAQKNQEEKTLRDKQRLKDVNLLQTALDKYYAVTKTYPKALSELTGTSTTGVTRLPKDPESGKTYLYSPFGDPPLNYSLSFVMEGQVGILEPGIQVVSSENKLPTSTIQLQDELIKGAVTITAGTEITITDLSQRPFYPQEEVFLELTAAPSLELSSVLLTIGGLKIMDKSKPFAFRFTAPKNPGEYPVEVFGFDKNGQGKSAKTKLIVSPPRP